jgi:hypothetical protein
MSVVDYRRLLEEERKLLLGGNMASSATQYSAEDNHAAKSDVECGNSDALVWTKTADLFKPFQLEKLSCIDSLQYCNDVLVGEAEDEILGLVERQSRMRPWIQLRNRSLQCWGDFPSDSGLSSSDAVSAPIPPWLDRIIDDLVARQIFSTALRPDNVLINRYAANEGILHHTDGPAYHDRVAILSLGSDCIMSFRPKLTPDQVGHAFAGDVCAVLLKRGSLFVFDREAYTDHLHGIIESEPVQVIGAHGPCVNVPSTDTGTKVVNIVYNKLVVANVRSHVLFHGFAQVVRDVRVSITFRKLKVPAANT